MYGTYEGGYFQLMYGYIRSTPYSYKYITFVTTSTRPAGHGYFNAPMHSVCTLRLLVCFM